MDDSLIVHNDESLDSIFNGALKVIQKKKGYRFSMDAVLLARSVRIHEKDRIIDLGTGCGIIPLIIASHGACECIVGVEIQSHLADIAKRNVRLNKKNQIIQIVECDINNIGNSFTAESFDIVVSNPPFGKQGIGRISPNQQRAIARHEILVELEELISAAFYLLRRGGRIYIIYPASRLSRMLYLLKKESLEPKIMRMVHSTMGAAAQLTIIEATKYGGEELKIPHPLYLYGPDGEYTEEVSRMYNLK